MSNAGNALRNYSNR